MDEWGWRRDRLLSELRKWKFVSALEYVDEEVPPGCRAVIEALAAMCGDCGWFYGNMGVVIGMAVVAIEHALELQMEQREQKQQFNQTGENDGS